MKTYEADRIRRASLDLDRVADLRGEDLDVPLLLEVLKRQAVRIALLNARIDALDARIDVLEGG